MHERDYALIDTLNEHYSNFAETMDDAYGNWRKYTHEELQAEADARRKALTRQVLGAAAGEVEHAFAQLPQRAALGLRFRERAVENLAYVAMLHMKRSAHEAVLARIGVPVERSIYLSDYGHIGQIDPLLSLLLARDQQRLRDGDVVVLCAAGIGYVWNALCLRYRAP